MATWEESYLGQLRGLVGNRTLLIPATRAVIQDDEKRVVLVRRRDNGMWVFPGGFMELQDVVAATLIAIHSEPRFAFTNVYGRHHQILNLIFRVDTWTGSLVQETDETLEARFFPLDNLPDIPDYEREIIEDFNRFSGQVMLR